MIRKEDRVSTVLKADPRLMDVFTTLSPAFQRLQRSGMRKVMSRLVTVEQAARIAGVDPDELLRRLNGADVATAETTAGEGPRQTQRNGGDMGVAGAADRPAALTAIPEHQVLELDVRDDLRQGKEPFSRIMAARREVPAGGALLLRAIFEPVPLYAVMERQGLAHHTEQLGAEDWCVWFYPAADESAGRERARGAGQSDGSDGSGSGEPAGRSDAVGGEVTVLDVRGLEPPEPMVRTLAALEALPAGGTLVQVNVRVPQFLLPQLEERGFSYEVREQRPDLVRVFIKRNQTGE